MFYRLISNKLTLWGVIVSILAAFFGVQSEKARERDFTTGSPAVFIVVGIVLTIFFILVLVFIVQWVLANY